MCKIRRAKHLRIVKSVINTYQSPGNGILTYKNFKETMSNQYVWLLKIIIQGGKPMKSFMASPSTIERKWYVVDATGHTLGRLSSEIASVLRGKNKPTYTPHVDTGDYVIVINADKIKVTGKKMDQKIYYNHSEYVGGMRETTLKEMMAKKPCDVITLAVKGMLPKGPLGRQMLTKLHVYAGAEHDNAAQKPEVLEIKSRY